MRGKSLAGLMDQGLWAVSSFILIAPLSHLMPASLFGWISVLLTVMILAAGLTAAATGEVVGVTRALLVKSGNWAEPDERRLVGYATKIAVMVAGAWLIGMSVVAFVLESADALLMVGLAVGGASFIACESLRTTLYGLLKTKSAYVMSGVWVVVQVSAILGAIILGHPLTASWALTGWGIGGLISAIIGICSCPGSWREGRLNALERRRRSHYMGEYVLTAGPAQALVPLVGLIFSIEEAGAIRVLQTVFGPLNVVIAGLRNVLVPRLTAFSCRVSVLRYSALMAGFGACATVAVTGLLALFPAIGVFLMGPGWPDDRVVLWGFGLIRLAFAVSFGALIALRALDEVKLSTRLRILTAVINLLPTLAGLALGLGWVMVVTGVLTMAVAAVWWIAAMRTGAVHVRQLFPSASHSLPTTE